MATKTYTGLTAVLAGNLDDTAIVPLNDKNGNTRKATIAQLRTSILLSGTGALGNLVAGDGTPLFSTNGITLSAARTFSSPTGTAIALQSFIKQTVANAGTAQTFITSVELAHPTGTTVQAIANVSSVDVTGAGTTTNILTSIAEGSISAGTVGTWTVHKVASPVKTGGTIALLYGLAIGPIDSGTTNWSIFCSSNATSGGVAFRNTALATNATVGHFFVPSCAGLPTGVPANIPPGQIAMQFDSVNNFLYAYLGGAWKKTTVFA